MEFKSHVSSKIIQVLFITALSCLLGMSVTINPMTSLFVFGFICIAIYAKIVLYDYRVILAAIIIVMPFNFEGLIAAINIPFVNPFNILWISYVGIVFLRAAAYSEPLFVRSPLNLPLFLLILSFTISLFQSKFVVDAVHFSEHIFPTYQK